MLILRKFLRDIPALIGLIIIVFAVVIAIVGPWIAPHPGDIVASHLLQRLKPPSPQFPFGTDNLGRDIFSRVILGTRGARNGARDRRGGCRDWRAARPLGRLYERLVVGSDHAPHRRVPVLAAVG